MPYVPPHKRHSNDHPIRPSPVPESLIPKFNRNLCIRPSQAIPDKGVKILYAKRAVSRWFLEGLNHTENGIPPSVQLVEANLQSDEGRAAERHMTLVNHTSENENNGIEKEPMSSPWISVAEKIEKDLLSTFESLKNETGSKELVFVKPSLVARFGKILFRGNPSMSAESSRESPMSETALRKRKKFFRTNVPSSYMENIKEDIVPKIGLSFQMEKDRYHVKLSDKLHPDATISCQCTVNADKRLNMCKAELNQFRHFVADVSCLDKNLDLRLMLCAKRILIGLTDDEMNSIKELIDSAVIDPTVKGGLRWPLGEASSGNRFTVCGVWHTVANVYDSQTLRLKVRHADRFDFRTGTGEVSREVVLVLKEIVTKLQGQRAEEVSVSDMLKDVLKTIWDHFLSCDPSLL